MSRNQVGRPGLQRGVAIAAPVLVAHKGWSTDVLEDYRLSGALPNADYLDIYDVQFDSMHVTDADCFHPSRAGHALLAETHWCRSQWGVNDPQCAN